MFEFRSWASGVTPYSGGRISAFRMAIRVK
jgi:hypothetical protein